MSEFRAASRFLGSTTLPRPAHPVGPCPWVRRGPARPGTQNRAAPENPDHSAYRRSTGLRSALVEVYSKALGNGSPPYTHRPGRPRARGIGNASGAVSGPQESRPGPRDPVVGRFQSGRFPARAPQSSCLGALGGQRISTSWLPLWSTRPPTRAVTARRPRSPPPWNWAGRGASRAAKPGPSSSQQCSGRRSPIRQRRPGGCAGHRSSRRKRRSVLRGPALSTRTMPGFLGVDPI